LCNTDGLCGLDLRQTSTLAALLESVDNLTSNPLDIGLSNTSIIQHNIGFVNTYYQVFY